MHTELLQSNFHTALRKVSRFLSTKPQLPILSCFFIEANSEGIWIVATDLQVGMRLKVDGTVIEPGLCVVPAKVLLELIGRLSGKIEMSLQGTSLHVHSEKVKSTINSFPAQDFPPFPVAEGETIEIPLEVFQKTVEFVTFASSKDETRPLLTSVLLNLSSSGVIVCTDGYRLAVLKNQFSNSTEKKVLFPSKSFDELTKVMDSSDTKSVTMTLSEGLKQAFFQLPSAQVVLRTIEGEYPNYQGIMPSSFSVEALIDADEFEHHVKSAMIFSSEGSSIVILSLSEDQIEVSSKSSVLGEYQSSLKAKIKIESPIKIAFNGRYLLDFFQRIAGKECVMKCNDPLKPAEFSCPDIPDYVYIAMPFRLNG